MCRCLSFKGPSCQKAVMGDREGRGWACERRESKEASRLLRVCCCCWDLPWGSSWKGTYIHAVCFLCLRLDSAIATRLRSRPTSPSNVGTRWDAHIHTYICRSALDPLLQIISPVFSFLFFLLIIRASNHFYRLSSHSSVSLFQRPQGWSVLRSLRDWEVKDVVISLAVIWILSAAVLFDLAVFMLGLFLSVSLWMRSEWVFFFFKN